MPQCGGGDRMRLVWTGTGIGTETVTGREKELWSATCCSELLTKRLLSAFGRSTTGSPRRHVDVYWGDLDDCLLLGADLLFKRCSPGKKLRHPDMITREAAACGRRD